MSPVTEAWLQYGALGLICLFLIGWIVRQEKAHKAEVTSLRAELKGEQDGRIADAKAFTDTALSLQERVISAVDGIRAILEEYGSLGTTVGELVKVLRERNGRRNRDTDFP